LTAVVAAVSVVVVVVGGGGGGGGVDVDVDVNVDVDADVDVNVDVDADVVPVVVVAVVLVREARGRGPLIVVLFCLFCCIRLLTSRHPTTLMTNDGPRTRDIKNVTCPKRFLMESSLIIIHRGLLPYLVLYHIYVSAT
jgi:hypothetical protein